MRRGCSCKVPREQIRIWAAHREVPYVYLKLLEFKPLSRALAKHVCRRATKKATICGGSFNMLLVNLILPYLVGALFAQYSITW